MAAINNEASRRLCWRFVSRGMALSSSTRHRRKLEDARQLSVLWRVIAGDPTFSDAAAKLRRAIVYGTSRGVDLFSGPECGQLKASPGRGG